MSRSDNPQASASGWPAQRPQGDYDLTQWTAGLGGAPLPNPKPQAAAPQYQAGVHQGYAQQQPAYGTHPAVPAAGYGAQDHHQDQGYYWGADPQAMPRAPLSSAPQFDPYVPATAHRQPQQAAAATGYAHGQQSAHGQPAGTHATGPHGQAYGYAQQTAYAPSQSYQSPQQAPELRGAHYDQWAASPAPADPRSYDLASYMPQQGRTQVPAPDYGSLSADLGTHEQQGYSDWGHQAGGYASAPQGYAGVPPGYDATGYDANGYDANGYGAEAYGDPAHAQGGYEDEAAYEEEEPPRRRKGLMVAAALVGAIVVGGGMTFAYQSLLGPGTDGPTPIVKSAEGPAKVKPSDPGGKQFAHSDSKLLGRLGDGGSASEADNAGGARKVTTLVVGRDGAIQPPAAPAAPAVSVPVPGMTLIDVPGGEAAPEPAPAPPAKAASPIVVQPPPAPSDEAPLIPRTVNAEVEPAPPPVAEKPKPKPVVKTAAIPETPAAPAAPRATPAAASLGYVAVLASVPASGSSRIDALQQFADLQQRYGGILQNKTPDVQEANLGERGRFHRLVVGPPGSKEGANSVCSQLKSAGYSGCWVMAY